MRDGKQVSQTYSVIGNWGAVAALLQKRYDRCVRAEARGSGAHPEIERALSHALDWDTSRHQMTLETLDAMRNTIPDSWPALET
jgi:hypothetical protein